MVNPFLFHCPDEKRTEIERAEEGDGEGGGRNGQVVHGEEVARESDAAERGEDANATGDEEDMLEALAEEARDEDGGDEKGEDE